MPCAEDAPAHVKEDADPAPLKPSPLNKFRASPMKVHDMTSPHSQASTAPCTPFQGWSLDPHHDLPEGVAFTRLHSAGSSTLGPEHEEDEAQKGFTTSTEEDLKECTTSTDEAEAEEEMSSDDMYLPEHVEDDPERITCAGMPPLQSPLGRWAEGVVKAEEWLEERMSVKFVVDNSSLKALTVGIAFRLSKDLKKRDRTVDGPHWGTTITGVDQGDGWVKVGRRYLPIMLDGKQVLIPAAATGHHVAACASTAKACSVDTDGVVHGAGATWKTRSFAGKPVDKASRLKSFHYRRLLSRSGSAADDEAVLCPDSTGKVFVYLYLDTEAACAVRRRCKRAALRRMQNEGASTTTSTIFSVDCDGVVQDWLIPGENL